MKKHIFRLLNVIIALAILFVPIFLWGGVTVMLSWLPALVILLYLEDSIKQIKE